MIQELILLSDSIIHLAVLHKKVSVLRDLLRVTATLENCGATNQANYLQQVHTPLRHYHVTRK